MELLEPIQQLGQRQGTPQFKIINQLHGFGLWKLECLEESHRGEPSWDLDQDPSVHEVRVLTTTTKTNPKEIMLIVLLSLFNTFD